MDNNEQSNNWVSDLEIALSTDCSINDIYCITKGRSLPNDSLRLQVYQKCLFLNSDNCFDYDNFNNDVDILKEFKTKNECDQNDYWLEILKVLESIEEITKRDCFQILEAILNKFIPKNLEKSSNVYQILRLLLQYHDPELCSFLDTKRVTPFEYCSKWFKTLFACCYVKSDYYSITLALWDIYFQNLDPFFIFFLILVLLINSRDVLLQQLDKKALLKSLEKCPEFLELSDVEEFCILAKYYETRTPKTFEKYIIEIFETKDELMSQKKLNNSLHNCNEFSISQTLCLPVDFNELITSVDGNQKDSFRRISQLMFFLVDCRSSDQYNAGHLEVAYHFDCNSILEENLAYKIAVENLLDTQKTLMINNCNNFTNIHDFLDSAGGHLCFMGSGRLEDDQYMHMVVASFLQRNTKYVSILTGGYKEIHQYFKEDLSRQLQDHNIHKCIECVLKIKNSINKLPKNNINVKTSQNPIDLFIKISSVMKTKLKLSDDVKIESKITENIPQLEDQLNDNSIDEKFSRNLIPVFSINDVGEQNTYSSSSNDSFLDDYDETREVTTLGMWRRSRDILAVFKCEELKENGERFESFLALTENFLIVLRLITDLKGFRSIKKDELVEVITRKPLRSILKITKKKRYPHLVSFDYGEFYDNTVHQLDTDRFLIKNSSHVINVISEQILKINQQANDEYN